MVLRNKDNKILPYMDKIIDSPIYTKTPNIKTSHSAFLVQIVNERLECSRCITLGHSHCFPIIMKKSKNDPLLPFMKANINYSSNDKKSWGKCCSNKDCVKLH